MSSLTLDDEKAYNCILNKDTKGLDKCEFHPRILITRLKNNLDGLEFLLKYINYDPGAGSYFFTDIEDNKTFDLYKKYDISPLNISKDKVTEEQWEYMYKIKYIDDEQYENGHA